MRDAKNGEYHGASESRKDGMAVGARIPLNGAERPDPDVAALLRCA
jgi:hypothetical protein